MDKVHIASFNCRGIKSPFIEVAKLCSKCDIILLQETWLKPCELNLICNVHADFECRAWSACNDNSGLIERPYGGLAIMWRKSLNVKWLIKCTLVNDRIAVLDISDSLRKLYLVNSYMPIVGDSIEQKEEYLNTTSLLSNTLEKVCIDGNVVVLGDFNASSSNGYLSFLDDFCYDEGFVIADMQRLHASSYTYKRYPGGPKSWIDYVLMSSWLLHKVNNITVGYDYVSFDHFPLFCDIDSNILKSRLTASLNEQISANNPNSDSLKCTINVDWDIVSDYERENFVNT